MRSRRPFLGVLLPAIAFVAACSGSTGPSNGGLAPGFGAEHSFATWRSTG